MEYSKNRLIQFKLDYQKYGMYNLDIQVLHLVRLAEFYESKYRETKNWTDCVRVSFIGEYYPTTESIVIVMIFESSRFTITNSCKCLITQKSHTGL